MLISIDWIKDFVVLPKLIPKELGEKLTLSTAEVEDVILVGEHFSKIKVAQITEVNKHPSADKLNLVKFDLGSGAICEVVCGAPNVKKGMKVPFAPLNTKFPSGLVLEPKKIRGIMSEGMLCSEQELGYCEESSGLMELKDDAPLGLSLKDYLKENEDILIDIDNKSLTHRPDLWGHFGIAREFSTIFTTELKDKFTKDWKDKFRRLFTKEKSPIVPVIEGECSCLGYFGLSVNNIEIKESPFWIQQRLKAVGLRPINNIVDISNYVMLDLGIPLHIFDRSKIKGNKLIIKRNSEKSTFVTLDEEQRELIESDTVIGDATGPLVLAGIMGGLSSGVTDNTSEVFIEVANWKAADVRKTSTRLGLRTDSSQRYEKTLDNQLLERTMYRTLELILEICPKAKVTGKLEYAGKNLSDYKPLVIDTSFKKINLVLGKEIEDKKIIEIFNFLDFKTSEFEGKLSVVVPSYRSTKDIEVEADLIEEIGRIIGYDNIVPESPYFRAQPVSRNAAHSLHYKIRDFLVNSSRSFEILTYPLLGKGLLEKASWDTNNELTLINAMSKEQNTMRPSLVPSFLEAVAKNQKHFGEFRFFEIGRSYLPSGNFSTERFDLALAFYNKENSPFLSLINETEKLFTSINLPFKLAEPSDKQISSMLPKNWIGIHPYESVNISVMGKNEGTIVSIHPLVLRSFKIKGNLSILLLNLSSFQDRKMKDKTKYLPLNKFPTADFDCTVLVDTDTKVGEVVKVLKKLKIKQMFDHKIVDVFELNSKQNAVTVRVKFKDSSATLSSEFLKESENSIVAVLKNAGFPLKT